MTAKAAKPGTRGPYSSQRQEARQQRILKVARQEIAAVGYDAITMQGLAAAAEVSPKTLYNLYGSKDALLLVAVENLLLEMRQEPAMVGAKQGVESLIATCEASAQLVIDSPNYVEAMARVFFQVDRENKLFQLLVGDTRSQAEEAFVRSQQQGELFAEVDTGALAELFTAQQWGLILVWSKGLIPSEQFPRVALRSQLTTIFPVSRKSLKSWLQAKAAAHRVSL